MFKLICFAAFLCCYLAAPLHDDASESKPLSSLIRPAPINPDVLSDPKPDEKVTLIKNPDEIRKYKREIEKKQKDPEEDDKSEGHKKLPGPIEIRPPSAALYGEHYAKKRDVLPLNTPNFKSSSYVVDKSNSLPAHYQESNIQPQNLPASHNGQLLGVQEPEILPPLQTTPISRQDISIQKPENSQSQILPAQKPQHLPAKTNQGSNIYKRENIQSQKYEDINEKTPQDSSINSDSELKPQNLPVDINKRDIFVPTKPSSKPDSEKGDVSVDKSNQKSESHPATVHHPIPVSELFKDKKN